MTDALAIQAAADAQLEGLQREVARLTIENRELRESNELLRQRIVSLNVVRFVEGPAYVVEDFAHD